MTAESVSEQFRNCLEEETRATQFHQLEIARTQYTRQQPAALGCWVITRTTIRYQSLFLSAASCISNVTAENPTEVSRVRGGVIALPLLSFTRSCFLFNLDNDRAICGINNILPKRASITSNCSQNFSSMKGIPAGVEWPGRMPSHVYGRICSTSMPDNF